MVRISNIAKTGKILIQTDTYRTRHNAPGFVHRHILLVTRMTHPFVTLDEKIATLPVPIGVRGVEY